MRSACSSWQTPKPVNAVPAQETKHFLPLVPESPARPYREVHVVLLDEVDGLVELLGHN
jgi:hypothetical protein